MGPSNYISRGWERKHKARPITAKEWEVHRDTFTRLYSTENRELTEVRRIMAEESGFFANSKQCKMVIKRWKLQKNLKKTKTIAMIRIRNKRTREGKETNFTFNDQPVSEQNLERARKRHKGTGEQPEWENRSSPVATPSFVEYWTPKSPVVSSPSYASPHVGGGTPSPRTSTCEFFESVFPLSSIEDFIYQLDSVQGISNVTEQTMSSAENLGLDATFVGGGCARLKLPKDSVTWFFDDPSMQITLPSEDRYTQPVPPGWAGRDNALQSFESLSMGINVPMFGGDSLTQPKLSSMAEDFARWFFGDRSAMINLQWYLDRD